MTNNRILQHQLNQLQAEVVMTAYSELNPDVSSIRMEPELFRFCYVVQGQALLHHNGSDHEIKHGRLYLLYPGEEQFYQPNGDEPFSFYWCHFRVTSSLEKRAMEPKSTPLYIDLADEPYIRSLFTKMIEAQSARTVTRELRMKSVLYELIAFFLDKSPSNTDWLQLTADGKKWNEVLTYIDQHLHRIIPVDDLARITFLHPNYFITSFKNIMGCAPIQYVTMQRLEAAKRLLEETSLPIVDIASKVGMLNHYLSRMFKRETGITPKQYRRIMQNRFRDGDQQRVETVCEEGVYSNGSNK